MSLAHHARHNALAVALNAGNALLVTVVAARLLGPGGMGAYSWLTWLQALAATAVHLGGITSATKHLAEAAGRHATAEASGVLAHGLARWGRRLAWVLAAWLLAGGCLPMAVPQGTWLLAAGLLVPATLVMWLVGACQGLQLHGAVARAAAAGMVVQVGGLAATAAAGLGVSGVLMAQGLAQAVTCVPLIVALSAQHPGWWRAEVSAEQTRALGRFGGSLAVIVLVDAVVWQRSGVLVLEHWASPAEVGYYALAFALAQRAMRTGPGALVGVLLPAMARSRGAGDHAALGTMYLRTGRWLALLALPLGAIGAACAKPLAVLLFGDSFAPMAPTLAVLLVGGATASVLGYPASSLLYALDRQVALQRAGLVGAGVYLGLVAWLVPGGGALQAALATVGAQAACLLLGVWLVRRSQAGCWPDAGRLAWTALAAATAGGVAAGPVTTLPPWPGLLAGACVGGLTYVALVAAMPVLSPGARARVVTTLRHGWSRRVTTVTTSGAAKG